MRMSLSQHHLVRKEKNTGTEEKQRTSRSSVFCILTVKNNSLYHSKTIHSTTLYPSLAPRYNFSLLPTQHGPSALVLPDAGAVARHHASPANQPTRSPSEKVRFSSFSSPTRVSSPSENLNGLILFPGQSNTFPAPGLVAESRASMSHFVLLPFETPELGFPNLEDMVTRPFPDSFHTIPSDTPKKTVRGL